MGWFGSFQNGEIREFSPSEPLDFLIEYLILNHNLRIKIDLKQRNMTTLKYISFTITNSPFTFIVDSRSFYFYEEFGCYFVQRIS